MGVGVIKYRFIAALKGRSRIRSLARVLVLGVAFALTACVSAWHKPEVSLAEAHLAGGNLLQQKIKLQLRIRNANRMEIGVESVVFDVQVGEYTLASGQSMAPLMIPAQGEALLELEAKAQILALLGRLPDLIDSEGKVRYRLKGEALIRGYGRTPFDQTGALDLGKFQGQGISR